MSYVSPVLASGFNPVIQAAIDASGPDEGSDRIDPVALASHDAQRQNDLSHFKQIVRGAIESS